VPANAGPHAVSSITVSGVGAGTHSFAYDAAGNMTSRSIVGEGTQSMGYDVFGQMASLSQGGVTTQYLYDAFGTRVRESSPAGHAVFVDRWAENDGSFHTQHFFIGDARFAFRYNNSLTYVVSDHLGSVIASNFTFFNDVKFRRYLPFGDVRGSATDVPTPYGYTGQRRDSTNLMYYQSRYYDPLVGRFTQADTIVPDAATPAAFNRYSYVINNPLKYVDPTGHCYGLPDGESVDRCVAGFQAARESVIEIYMGGSRGVSASEVEPRPAVHANPVTAYENAVAYAYFGARSDYILEFLYPIAKQVAAVRGVVAVCPVIGCGYIATQDGEAKAAWRFGLAFSIPDVRIYGSPVGLSDGAPKPSGSTAFLDLGLGPSAFQGSCGLGSRGDACGAAMGLNRSMTPSELELNLGLGFGLLAGPELSTMLGG
jgi:RHS repeat-associated protein